MNYFNEDKMTVSLSGDDILFGTTEWWVETDDNKHPYLDIPVSCYFDVKKVLGIEISDKDDTVLEMSLMLYMEKKEVKIDMWLDGSEYESPAYILFELAEGSAASIIQAAAKAAQKAFNLSLDAVFAMNNRHIEEIVLLIENVVMTIHMRENGDDSDGWDHTIYDFDGEVLDGGVYNDSDSILGDAFAEFRQWYGETTNRFVTLLPFSLSEFNTMQECGRLREAVEKTANEETQKQVAAR